MTSAELSRKMAQLDEQRREFEAIEAYVESRKAEIDREGDEKKRAVLARTGNQDLSFLEHPATVVTMDAIKTDVAVTKRRAGAKPKKNAPVTKVADALGLSLVDLSAKVGESYEAMRTWNSRGKVPDDVETKFSKLIKQAKKRSPKSGR